MHVWPVQDAKARFSEFLDACLAKGPQMVTRRGTATAVLVPLPEWQRLQASAQPGLKELLLSDTARAELDVPPRGRGRARRRRESLWFETDPDADVPTGARARR